MSTENKALIQKINEAFAQGNTDFFLHHLAEDARWNIISISTITGKDNIEKNMEVQGLETFPVVTVKNVTEQGDSVVVESTGNASRKRGAGYTASYCDIYRMENGKIKEFTTYVIETV